MPRYLLKSLKITVSTKEDLSTESINLVTKWCERQDMHHVVLERGESGKLHLHAIVCMNKGQYADKVQENLWQRKVRPFHSSSIGRYAVVVNANYDSYWINEYLKKEAGYEVVSSHYDVNREGDYYPGEEVQLALQAINSRYTAVDSFYAEHELLFKEYVKLRSHPQRGDALEYFYDRMFVKKDMRVISDSRRLRQMATALYRYAFSDKTMDFEDRKWVASETGPVFDFRG